MKVKEVVKCLRKQGWSCEIGKSGHWRCTPPGGRVVCISKTPSDYRTWLNDRARLRRAGAAL